MSADMAARIQARVARELAAERVDVQDEGHLHAGHAGEGQGHYRVRVVSAAFQGLVPIKRHRRVYAAVDEWMGNGIHALAIEALTPAEAATPPGPSSAGGPPR